MAKKASESRQRMKRMVPKPYEESDKSYGVVCILQNCLITRSKCLNKGVFPFKLSSNRCNVIQKLG